VTVPVEDVAVGDRVLVQPGEKIPLDGVVREGESAVNEAPITGESVPVDKGNRRRGVRGHDQPGRLPGSRGHRRGGRGHPRASSSWSRTHRQNRTEREQFVDRFAGYYTPVMVALAVPVAVVPPLVLSGR